MTVDAKAWEKYTPKHAAAYFNIENEANNALDGRSRTSTMQVTYEQRSMRASEERSTLNQSPKSSRVGENVYVSPKILVKLTTVMPVGRRRYIGNCRRKRRAGFSASFDPKRHMILTHNLRKYGFTDKAVLTSTCTQEAAKFLKSGGHPQSWPFEDATGQAAGGDAPFTNRSRISGCPGFLTFHASLWPKITFDKRSGRLWPAFARSKTESEDQS